MKKTLSTLRAILPHLIVIAFVFAPLIAFGADAATPPAAAGTFTPLNPIPGIFEAGNAPSLPTFFNGLYKICIGVAATIAVLQIMRAGFLFMVNQGSVSHNEAAKSLLTNSILGLVLVLSPAIVFGIINPKILSLNLDVSSLQPSVTSSTTPGQFNGADAYLWEHTPSANDASACAAEDGTLSYQCRKKDESGGKTAGKDDTCASDENKYSVCSPTGSTPSSGNACKVAYGSDIKALNLDGTTFTCDASAGYTSVPHGCCNGSNAAGTICCARPAGQKFILAYYRTQKNTSTNYTCYAPVVGLYPSADSCATAKAQAPNIGQAQGVTTL
ncbi:MAG: hypothetical protein JWN90_102, partial [Parcubacteria group bacterium]|nr:hypothetical protein [Parcubacteria group bacterium]